MSARIERQPIATFIERVTITYDDPPQRRTELGSFGNRREATVLVDRVHIRYEWDRPDPGWGTPSTVIYGRQIRADGTPGAPRILGLFFATELAAFVNDLIRQRRPDWTPPNLTQLFDAIREKGSP